MPTAHPSEFLAGNRFCLRRPCSSMVTAPVIHLFCLLISVCSSCWRSSTVDLLTASIRPLSGRKSSPKSLPWWSPSSTPITTASKAHTRCFKRLWDSVKFDIRSERCPHKVRSPIVRGGFLGGQSRWHTLLDAFHWKKSESSKSTDLESKFTL